MGPYDVCTGMQNFIQETHSPEWCANEKKAHRTESETFPGIPSDAKPSLFFFNLKFNIEPLLNLQLQVLKSTILGWN